MIGVRYPVFKTAFLFFLEKGPFLVCMIMHVTTAGQSAAQIITAGTGFKLLDIF